MTDCVCTYEITVFGMIKTDQTKLTYYPISFRIYYRHYLYEVWVSIEDLILQCEIFYSEIDAKLYINQSMKNAMKNHFVYRDCVFCNRKSYYPNRLCENCNAIYFATIWKIDNSQNEKRIHLGHSLSKYETTWHPSFFTSSETEEKL